MIQNRAAWTFAAQVKPFNLDKVPAYKPGRREILFKAHAVTVIGCQTS